MIDHLKKLETLRGAAIHPPHFLEKLQDVKCWQHDRLARTYRDLAADTRYAPAVAFFLDELYGAGDSIKNSALRDHELIRMYPTIKRVLPKFAFDAVKKALELDVLAEEFDQALATQLGVGEITEGSYAMAFRAAGRRDDRLRQVQLMLEVGKSLDVVVKKPLIYSTLKMLRGPSKLAGLAAMQRFLETGFTAFRHMQGADYFLETIAYREAILINRIFDKMADPFEVIKTWQPRN